MTSYLPILIVVWLGVAYVLFRKLPGPVAVLIVVIAGQLFLPELHAESIDPGVPVALRLPVIRFTKVNTIGYALLFGSLITDWRRWRIVVPQWFDLPMAAWCICPLFPAVVNGIGPLGGLYEGSNQVLNQTLIWGVPYWFGRLYLGSPGGLRAAAAAIILGGLIYAPLCLLELRLSPQLHRWVYGFHQHDFVQTQRDGGYRPMVFMEHGLMVSFWMMSTALTAFWVWRQRTFRVLGLHRHVQISLGLVAAGLAAIVLMSHSTGAVVLGAGGAVVLILSRWLRTVVPILALALLPPVYVAARYTQMWDAQDLVELTREYGSEERAESLAYRLKNEYKLLDRAKEQAIFGWGDTGDARSVEQVGTEKVVTDSLWIITVGNRGLFGLVALIAALLTPVLLFLWYDPPRIWTGPLDAPAAVLAVILCLYLLDHMVNAMINPVFALMAGGLTGAVRLYQSEPERQRGGF
jgi:hypothetical protein